MRSTIICIYLTSSILSSSLHSTESYPGATNLLNGYYFKKISARSTTLRVYELTDIDRFSLNIPKSEMWNIGLMEEQDLEKVSNFLLESFFVPTFKFNSLKVSQFEAWILENIIKFRNYIEKFELYLGNFLGFKTRCGRRLSRPNLLPGEDSLVLIIVNKITGSVIGVVELGLEKPNGKLSPAISSPLKLPVTSEHEPYLCNLCVSNSYRRNGIGKLLCEIGENIVLKKWNKRSIYLHVEKKNEAAVSLYKKLNYVCIDSPLPPWEVKSQQMSDILYFRKDLQLRASVNVTTIDEKDSVSCNTSHIACNN